LQPANDFRPVTFVQNRTHCYRSSRIVKSFFTDRGETRGGSRHAPEVERPAPTFTVLTKRPVVADEAEVERNPRARSAKLRAAERTSAPNRAALPSGLLPQLPSFNDVLKGR
jgi:16S rRNA (cytosine1402-N4)-methyltransferase